MTSPSNANTSGLEVVAWRKNVWVAEGIGTGWMLSNEQPEPNHQPTDIEPLVTAASAQERIAELEAEIAEMIAERSRRSVAWQRSEARADRLAKGMPDLSSVIGWLANGCDSTHAVTELRILQARINHALQQETQP